MNPQKRFTLPVFLLMSAACASLGRTGDGPAADLPGPGEAPRLFAPGVVSTGDVFASAFTPDGRTVVFTKAALPRMWLMQSRFSGGAWSSPETLPFSGVWRDLDPALSPDGSRLYFSSWRPIPGSGGDTTSLADTWFVNRAGDGWGAPIRLGAPANSNAVDMYPSVTRAGTLYFDSGRGGRREVYRVAAGSGASGPAERLDSAINGSQGASNFFIDPDERYAIFGATRPEGHGESDLYVSWRVNGRWTPARNLGPRVNSPATEFCPFVSHDGRHLYFTRITPTGVSPVVRNIFVVRVDDLLTQLRPAP